PKREPIDGAVFLARQMFRRGGGQPVQSRDKRERGTGARYLVPTHQILDQKKIWDCRADRHNQYSNGRFSLVEQSPNECKSHLQTTTCERVAQLKNDSATRKLNQGAHIVQRNNALLCTEKKVQLFKLALDRAGVAASQKNEEIKSFVFKTQ